MISYDVVGVGANSVDYVYTLPQFPQPDSPTAKLRVGRHVVSCGGQTATALCTCAAMGLRAKYVGTVGNDDNGRMLRTELSRRGVDIDHAYVRDASNPFAVILLEERRGERVVLWHREAPLDLQAAEVDPAVIVRSRALHVDDVDEGAAIRAAAIGREAGIPVTSDIERVTARTEELVAAVTVPIFAEHALEPLTGERDFERALRVIRRRHSGMLGVTLGARGAMLLDGDRLHYDRAHAVAVEDTTGAGDVFRGAFLAALLAGEPAAAILRFANAAAALSCTRLGAIASVPTREETEAFLRFEAKGGA
jgi:sugar/nucleoside kinase (ribokinase family)